MVLASAFKQVFSDSRYALLAVAMSLAAFVLATWLPNLGLVWQITTSGSVSLADKVAILTALIGSIGTNFTIFSGFSVIAIAVLFGMNVAMIVYSFRLRRELGRRTGQGIAATSLGGLVSGLFGIGCAACGTLLLSPALSFVGGSALVALLPFKGEEFGALGMAILGLSLLLSARAIAQPIMCQISNIRSSAGKYVNPTGESLNGLFKKGD